MNTTSLYLSGSYLQSTQAPDYQWSWPIIDAWIIPNDKIDMYKNLIAEYHFGNYVCYFLILVAALIAPLDIDRSIGIALGAFICGIFFSWAERRYTNKLSQYAAN